MTLSQYLHVSIAIYLLVLDYYTKAIKILQSEQYIEVGILRMKDLDFEKIGKKIKEIRMAKHLTQEYIANATDVNTSHISNIENNRVKVSLSTLVQICNALDTTIDYILSDEYKDPDSAIEQEILHEIHGCNLATKEQILKIIKALQ